MQNDWSNVEVLGSNEIDLQLCKTFFVSGIKI